MTDHPNGPPAEAIPVEPARASAPLPAGNGFAGTITVAFFGTGLLVVIAVLMGSYGFSLFLGVPAVVGFTGALVRNRKGVGQLGTCLGGSILAVTIVLSLLLLTGFEGLICIVMALPICAPPSLLGGYMAYVLLKNNANSNRGFPLGVLALMAPLGGAAIEKAISSPGELFAARSSIVVNHAPDEVWRSVVEFPALASPDEWLFKTGLAYPCGARIDGAGVGATRYCDFSTGSFVEPIEVWDAPRLLRFTVSENPPPMREWSPWGEIHPPHLHGYLVAERGQFELTALPNGRTRIDGTTWYRHNMQPAWYWRLWSDQIVHRIHMRVLEHIKATVEQHEGNATLAFAH